ncbi:hypothetical protein M9H77_01417 [Catharanthus roseus]|uniref:Uncharacterized protein n=1 Tax=Catharanthus roseus TaxID=4058 RepID=A0ACC0C5L8_CATRO|nr:hypothetical protein M9H77_01417 [Catharanthus roseus]
MIGRFLCVTLRDPLLFVDRSLEGKEASGTSCRERPRVSVHSEATGLLRNSPFFTGKKTGTGGTWWLGRTRGARSPTAVGVHFRDRIVSSRKVITMLLEIRDFMLYWNEIEDVFQSLETLETLPRLPRSVRNNNTLSSKNRYEQLSRNPKEISMISLVQC